MGTETILLKSLQNVQECDATMFTTYSKPWLIKAPRKMTNNLNNF